MPLQFHPPSATAPLASLVLVTSCGSDYKEREKVWEAKRQKSISSAEVVLSKFGSTYGAKPWEMAKVGGESKFTAKVQEEVKGSRVVFRAQIIDVVRSSGDDYVVVVGDHLIGRDIAMLRGARSSVTGILENPASTFDEFFIVADIHEVKPLLLELSPCDDAECTASLAPSITGIARRVFARLVALEADRSRNADQ